MQVEDMKKQPVILLVGKKQSGKDTFFELLAKQSPRFKRFAFADKLKSICKAVPGYERAEETHGKEVVRPLLQAAGDVIKQGCGHRFFIDAATDNIHRVTEIHPDTIPVVTDCRFLAEADEMRKHFDCCVVRIVRPQAEDGDVHVSETEQDLIEPDITITNDKEGLSELAFQAEAVSEWYLTDSD